MRDSGSLIEELKLFNLIADYLWCKVYAPSGNVPIPSYYLSHLEWKNILENEGLKVQKITYPEPNNPYRMFMMLVSL